MTIRREDVRSGKTSVSSQKIIDMLSTISQRICDLFKEVYGTVVEFPTINRAGFNSRFKAAVDYKDEVELIKKEVLDYISKVAPALYNKEDWLRILFKLSDISDKSLGVMYRLEQLMVNGGPIPKEPHSYLVELSEVVAGMLNEYKHALLITGIDSDKALEACGRIEEMEREADEAYRRTVFSVLSSNVSFRELLLMKDIADMLENISDATEAATDDLRIILFSLL